MRSTSPLNPAAVRQIPLPKNKINLNAGTLHPTPFPIQQRVGELRSQLASNPSDFCWRELPKLIQTSRAATAAYLNCKPDELLLVPNITFAHNLIVSSLTLPKGTDILITDHEYGAMVYAWQRWAGVRDWNLRTLSLPIGPSLTAEQYISHIEQALTPATRVLFLYHCASPTGLVLPLKEICALARSKDIITVIDGAHAPGMIPVDINEIGADFYAANLHKWVMAPAGAGFLHVARNRRLDIRPLITSWGWPYNRSEAFEDSGNGGSRWQWDLEFHGTLDRCPQMVLPETIAFRRELGSEADIYAHHQNLSDFARKLIPLPCMTPEDPRLRGGLTIFEVPTPPNKDPNVYRDILYHTHGIEAPTTSTQGRYFLRISTATFNTEEDIHQLAQAVKQIWK